MRVAIWGLMALGFCCGNAAGATSLRVSPVLLDLQAPRQSATLRLRNDEKRDLNVQVRVFRWSQKNGADNYEPTTAIVVSPPATRLASGVDYTVRVVRTSKAPIVAEESYRVLIDEVPTSLVRRSGTVNLVMRHAIPVFFRTQRSPLPKVTWKIVRDGSNVKLVAQNVGGTRLRLSDLNLMQGNGKTYQKKGLLGYVLAGSTVAWPVKIGRQTTGTSLTLKADSQLGPVNEIVSFVGR
ncbi:MAG: molecular chaperone [Hyphomicrobiaceae bacterium]